MQPSPTALLRHRLPARRSAPQAWRALTGAELAFCWPVLERLCGHEVGRPATYDVLSRFEACLEAACSPAVTWRRMRTASAPKMAGDTLHRCFRRWTARGVWMALLRRMAVERPALSALEWFLCLAYRRAWRLQGLRGIVLARETGLVSALRAPPALLPDPGLSAACLRAAARVFPTGGAALTAVVEQAVRVLGLTLRLARGASHIPRAAKAGW